MKPIGLRVALILFLSVAAASAQNSGVLKKASKYMPSLTEIGFITGAINTYVQTATLVRAVNREIALAKSMSRRLDDLQGETEQMLGKFGTLSSINPYDMDSWAAWLDRADGLATEETSDFVDVLFNSVLKTLDDRMTVGFYSEIQRGLSYDVSQGRVGEVLRAYYLNREYQEGRDKIRTVALNARRLDLLARQAERTEVHRQLRDARDPDTRTMLGRSAAQLESDIRRLEGEIQDPAVEGTSSDRQIALLMDMAQALGGEIPAISKQLDAHQQDLAALNTEWQLAAKDRLPKSKNRTLLASPVAMDRVLYHPTDADRVPAPANDVEKPSKQNTSETAVPTSLSDLLQLQNKVEFKKLEMAENALTMDLQIAQGKAVLLAVMARTADNRRSNRTNVIFDAENLENLFRVRWRR
jgi:hypothetical protein